MNQKQNKAAKIILDYLEETNAHTLAKLLSWELYGEKDPNKDEILFRAYLSAKNFLSSFALKDSNE